MDIRALRYFIAIVDCGSLNKAAELVCVAQPALSVQVASLESDLGVPLLVRSSKGVTPTEAGKALYRNARTILRQLDAARDEIRSSGAGVGGPVAVGLPTTVAAVVAMRLVRAVREHYPQVRLQLFESMSGYIEELLAGARLDFAVLFREADSRAVELEPLARESLSLIGQPGTALPNPGDSVQLAAFAGLPLVLPSAAHGLRLLIQRSCAQAGISLELVAELDSLPCLLGMAQEGLAYTILPASVLAATGKEIPAWRIEPELCRTLSLCRPRSAPRTPAALAVEGLLREIVGELVRNDGVFEGI